MIQTRTFPNGTSLTQSFPWGLYVRARAMCSDGRIRSTKHLSNTADTFFSVPASVEVKHRTVSGYITITDEGVRFIAYTYGKNGHLLPEDTGVKVSTEVDA